MACILSQKMMLNSTKIVISYYKLGIFPARFFTITGCPPTIFEAKKYNFFNSLEPKYMIFNTPFLFYKQLQNKQLGPIFASAKKNIS